MNSEQLVSQLLDALLILKKMPINELIDNNKLKGEIQKVISSKNLQNIMGSLWRDRQLEKQDALNSNRDSEEALLPSYVQYQSAVFKKFSENKLGTQVTSPLTRKSVQAFNEHTQQKSPRKLIESLPEAKKFADVFNSIYSDRSLQINTARDPTFMSSYIDYSPYTLNYQYYLSIPTLDQTIDLPISMSTRQDPIINFDSEELTIKFEKYFRRRRLIQPLKKLLLYSSLSPRGSLIVPIVDSGQVRFNVFNDTQFTYAAAQQTRMADFQDTDTGVGQLFCLGNILQNEVTAHFLCPGFEPIFAIGKNRTYRLKEAAEAINIYLYTIKVLCIRAQVIVQKWAGKGLNDTKLAQLQNLTQRLNSELSLSTSLEVPDDAEIDILNNNLSPGFADVQPIIKEFQGMITGVMPDYIYGSDTAYAANSFNLNVTHQNIRSQIQEAQIEPAIRFMVNSILANDSDFKRYANERDNYDVEFDSLYEMTDAEKATLDAQKIDNITSMASYPELRKYFVTEGLWREDQEITEILEPDPET